MTSAQVRQDAAPLAEGQVPHMIAALERGFGATPPGREAILFHQGLLDVLDRGGHGRCLVWPARDPVAICHVGIGGRILPAGDPDGAAPLADAIGAQNWRVVIGDLPLSDAMMKLWTRGLFRRRYTVREQRYMRILPEDVAAIAPPEGMRTARAGDLDEVAELAARLHVEDLMRPPLSRSGRASVRARMAESIDRGDTFVVERAGRVVAKTDVSMYSRSRGAQIAGVYVEERARAQGLATGLVAAVARTLVLEGLPGVTLHVRSDNEAAKRAYVAAGFVDVRPLTLAVR